MNKKVLIGVIVVVVAIIAVVAVVSITKANNTPVIAFESKDDSIKVAQDIYAKIDMSQMPMIAENVLDLSDTETVQYLTGVQDPSKINYAVVSEPMMSAQAYAMVLVKVKDGEDVEKIKQEMVDNIDVRRWICVAAEKVYATNHHNLICMVMSSEERALPVYNAFKELVENKIGKELVKTGEM
ncbi:MAG: hypothetical protein IKV94_05570 [Clostridia bacterium]|nr:hypothetical protein [Clostridia bacterium]